MLDLNSYHERFDVEFPDYKDSEYEAIKQLVELLDAPGVLELLHTQEFKNFAQLIQPLIAIKNYKSQIPFPHEIGVVIESMVKIRTTKTDAEDKFKYFNDLIKKLLSIEGFQLPTVSAILHFCHPFEFPIVDVNVEAACKTLQQECHPAFDEMNSPKLPGPQESYENKMDKYRNFISFIDRVIELQLLKGGKNSYREMDKALMVLGREMLKKERLRRSIEKVEQLKKEMLRSASQR